MKTTALDHVHTWPVWQADKRIDFNGFLWTRPAGNLLVDPMPLSDDQRAFLDERGGAARILVTNADHLRAAPELKDTLGAELLAPQGDRERFGEHASLVDHWFDDALPGELGELAELRLLRGGKGPVEPALYLTAERAWLFGDLVRSHVSGRLMLLPEAKCTDRPQLTADVKALAGPGVDAVLLGDGDSLFRGAAEAWDELQASL